MPPPTLSTLHRGRAALAGSALFAVLMTLGACLRLLVALAYQPALLLQRDAYAYLFQAGGAGPSGGFRPAVYPLVLEPLLLGHNLAVVPAVQHVAALGIAGLLFALLRRSGAGPVASALGTAPLLLDPYQVDLEQYVLTETLFELLVIGALALLLWGKPPSVPAAAAAGVLLVAAGLTRYAGLALIVPALIFLLVTRAGAARIVALAAAFAVPLAAYSAVGRSLSSGGPGGKVGFFLYGRVAAFADCEGLDLAAGVRRHLCGPGPGAEAGYFKLNDRLGDLIDRPDANRVLLGFSVRVIAHQPLAYSRAVGGDLGRYFDTTPPQAEEPYADRWRFVTSITEAHPIRFVARRGGSPPAELGFEQTFTIDRRLASWLGAYQRYVYTWGPLLGLVLLAGTAGAIMAAGGQAPLARTAALFSAAGLVLLLFPVAVTVYHVRYVVPALPLVGPAGAAGASALWQRVRVRQPAGGAESGAPPPVRSG